MGENLADGVENPWRMTYVSLEKTNVDTNRFSGNKGGVIIKAQLQTIDSVILLPEKLQQVHTADTDPHPEDGITIVDGTAPNRFCKEREGIW